MLLMIWKNVYLYLLPKFLSKITVVADLNSFRRIAWVILYKFLSSIFLYKLECIDLFLIFVTRFELQLILPYREHHRVSCGQLGVSILLVFIYMSLKSYWYCPCMEIPSSIMSRHSCSEDQNSIFSYFLSFFSFSALC